MFGYVKRVGPVVERLASLIGANLTIDGDITFSGAVRIDGVVNGDVRVPVRGEGDLILGETGRIEGDVRVSDLAIGGRVEGSVFATGIVSIAASGRVSGEVHYGDLQLESGGEVDGSLLPLRVPGAFVTRPAPMPSSHGPGEPGAESVR